MKFVRYHKEGRSFYGALDTDTVTEIEGDIFSEFSLTRKTLPLHGVTVLSPVMPSKTVAVGRNYRDHAREMDQDVPEEPLLFIKPSTAVIGPEENILYPDISHRVDYEAELGVVIKKRLKNATPEEAKKAILGYTCFNDVTARDIQKKDGQWTRAKSFDTFAPVGPCIVTDLDPQGLTIESYLNGQRRQSSHTSLMIFTVFDLISCISRVMTLLPGDLVATGTPEGVGPMTRGDVVEVVIEGIGRLRNRVV